jgi:hypothetical protein
MPTPRPRPCRSLVLRRWRQSEEGTVLLADDGLDQTGVTNLLMKPFAADALAGRIKELIARRNEANGWSG